MKKKYNADSVEKPGKEIRKPTLRQRRNWYSIKIILGAYLVYLSYQIGSGIFTGKIKDQVVWLGIAAAVFCVFGVAFIILNLRSLQTDRGEDDEDTPPKDKIDHHK